MGQDLVPNRLRPGRDPFGGSTRPSRGALDRPHGSVGRGRSRPRARLGTAGPSRRRHGRRKAGLWKPRDPRHPTPATPAQFPPAHLRARTPPGGVCPAGPGYKEAAPSQGTARTTREHSAALPHKTAQSRESSTRRPVPDARTRRRWRLRAVSRLMPDRWLSTRVPPGKGSSPLSKFLGRPSLPLISRAAQNLHLPPHGWSQRSCGKAGVRRFDGSVVGDNRDPFEVPCGMSSFRRDPVKAPRNEDRRNSGPAS